MSIEPTFSGEVQFVTYADSSKGGPRITLRLPEREQLESFIGMEAKRFMLVMVQIGDDEQASPPDPRPGARKPPTGPICQWLVMRCKEPEFQQWLTRRVDSPKALTEAECAEQVRLWCGVKSRSDIDGDPAATKLFKQAIQRPWQAFIGQPA